MKTLYALSVAILITAAMTAHADPGTPEMRAPGQPFIHPLDDQSYNRNITDDQQLANDPYDYENAPVAPVPSASRWEDERQSAANSYNADPYDNENTPTPTMSSRYDRQAAASDPDDYENAVQPTDNGRVRYISGGVADSGMQVMDMKQNGYNLKTLFVRDPNGEYLANVGVTVTDKDGSLLQTTTRGPVLLANLPPGTYTVTASTEGGDQTLTQRVKVGRDHLSSYTFRFQALEASQE